MRFLRPSDIVNEDSLRMVGEPTHLTVTELPGGEHSDWLTLRTIARAIRKHVIVFEQLKYITIMRGLSLVGCWKQSQGSLGQS